MGERASATAGGHGAVGFSKSVKTRPRDGLTGLYSIGPDDESILLALSPAFAWRVRAPPQLIGAVSPPTDNRPQPKEAQPLSQLDIRLI